MNLADFSGFSDALNTLGSNADLYSTMEDLQRDQGRTANEVAEFNELNSKQLTSTEQTVKALQYQFDVAEDNYKLQMPPFDSHLEFAQAQMDALTVLWLTDSGRATVEKILRNWRHGFPCSPFHGVAQSFQKRKDEFCTVHNNLSTSGCCHPAELVGIVTTCRAAHQTGQQERKGALGQG